MRDSSGSLHMPLNQACCHFHPPTGLELFWIWWKDLGVMMRGVYRTDFQAMSFERIVCRMPVIRSCITVCIIASNVLITAFIRLLNIVELRANNPNFIDYFFESSFIPCWIQARDSAACFSALALSLSKSLIV